MGRFRSRRPSGAMVVAVVALAVALSGTAVAATARVSGDKLIKKVSLSGNRLRNTTVSACARALGLSGAKNAALHASPPAGAQLSQ